MGFNQDKLNEIAKPRSEESIAKEQYWLEHKDEILKQHMDKLIESALRDMNELEQRYEGLCKNYIRASQIGDVKMMDKINADMKIVREKRMQLKNAYNSFYEESQIK